MTAEASWCFLWACPLPPLRLPAGLGSLLRSSSGTGAQEPDCLSPTAARPAASAPSAAASAAAAVVAAAEPAGILADCRSSLFQKS